jgi:hypothetical protein
VYHLIQVLQDIEAANERTMARLAMGAPPKKRKEKYVMVDETLQRQNINTFGRGIPNIVQVLQFIDAAAFQLWDVKQ